MAIGQIFECQPSLSKSNDQNECEEKFIHKNVSLLGLGLIDEVLDIQKQSFDLWLVEHAKEDA